MGKFVLLLEVRKKLIHPLKRFLSTEFATVYTRKLAHLFFPKFQNRETIIKGMD